MFALSGRRSRVGKSKIDAFVDSPKFTRERASIYLLPEMLFKYGVMGRILGSRIARSGRQPMSCAIALPMFYHPSNLRLVIVPIVAAS